MTNLAPRIPFAIERKGSHMDVVESFDHARLIASLHWSILSSHGGVSITKWVQRTSRWSDDGKEVINNFIFSHN